MYEEIKETTDDVYVDVTVPADQREHLARLARAGAALTGRRPLGMTRHWLG